MCQLIFCFFFFCFTGLLVTAQARHCSRNVASKTLSGSDRLAKEYSVYKSYLMLWSLVDLVYTMFKSVSTPKPEDWPISLFDYIRRNDEAMVKSADSILETFTDEHLPCTSFGEFCDVAGEYRETRWEFSANIEHNIYIKYIFLSLFIF